MDIRVKLLIRAKALIESGEERFICWALDSAHTQIFGVTAEEGTAELNEITERIRRELEGYPYLSMWAKDQGCRIQSQSHRTLARMAWIDKLIEEFSREP